MRKWILVANSIIILCVLIIGSIYLYYQHIETTNVNTVYIILKKNSTLQQVAKQLQEKNIIESQRPFIYYANVNGLKERIEDGNFIIKPKTNLNGLITKFKDGKSEFTVITIPEGYTLYQTASKLDEKHLVKKEEILNKKLNDLKNNTLILSKNGVYYDLEGYLFPDTYYIPNNTTKDEIINIMVNRFKTVFSDKYKSRTKELGLDVNEVITIASIIEREAANNNERARIAGVIYNRLKKGMPLQVDAAVIYANTKGRKNIAKVYYVDCNIKCPKI